MDSSQSGTVALPPDHAFMVGRGNLAATLNQRAVSIEQQLRVKECAAITFVDANGHYHPGLSGGFADGMGGDRWYRHGLFNQPQMFRAHFERPLYKREI